jgi:drug/metabolite transporter (DMT)-like permease
MWERAWVVLALLTMIAFAGSNFLSGAIGHEAAVPKHAGLSNAQVQMLIDGSTGVVIALGLLVFGGLESFTKDPRASAAQIASGVVLAIGNYVLTSALASNFRMGPYITGMLPLNAVFLTVACSVFFGEATTQLQLIAIFISIIGSALMATADLSPSGVDGVLFGLITAVCYAIGNFGIKYASIRGLPHTSGVALLLLGMGLTGICFFAVQTSSTHKLLEGLGELNRKWGGGESQRLYCFSALSGCLQTLAICCMKLAVSMGPAAPAMAIANSNAVGVLILNVIFFHTTAGAQQLSGLCVTIAGVAMLSVVPKGRGQEQASKADPDAKHPLIASHDGEEVLA